MFLPFFFAIRGGALKDFSVEVGEVKSNDGNCCTMGLAEHLSGRKKAVVKRWFDIAVATYPAETQAFFTTQKDQFANPVGYTFSQGLEAIFDELLGTTDFDKITPFLDDLMRIRALQDTPPSQAVAFIFDLKGVVRAELRQAKTDLRSLDEEFEALEAKIDYIALLAFDGYMKCREKIYDIKATEFRNMTSKLVERANALFERHYREAGDKEKE